MQRDWPRHLPSEWLRSAWPPAATATTAAPRRGKFELVPDAPAGYSQLAGDADPGTRQRRHRRLAEAQRPGAADRVCGPRPQRQLHRGGSRWAALQVRRRRLRRAAERDPPRVHLERRRRSRGRSSSGREVPVGGAGSIVLHAASADHRTDGRGCGRSGRIDPGPRRPPPSEEAEGEAESQPDKIACAELEGPPTPPPARSWTPAACRRSWSATANRSAASQELEYSAGDQIQLPGQLRRRRRGPRPRLRPDEGRRQAGGTRRASTSRPKSKGSSRSSWRAARSRSWSCGSTRELGLPFAHALVARQDLPVPAWLFAWGASIVLIVSFFALSAAWRKPRFEQAHWRPLGAGLSRARWSPAAAGRSAALVGVFLLGVGDLRRPARHRSPGPQLRPHLLLRHRLARLPLLLGPARRHLPALQPLARDRPRRRRRLPRSSPGSAPRHLAYPEAPRPLAGRDRPARRRLAGGRLRLQRRRRRRPRPARGRRRRAASTASTRWR